MEVDISPEKSIEQNAVVYFEKAKKAKKKLSGLKKAIVDTRKKILEMEKSAVIAKAPARKRKRQWFEAFHWFVSSNGFLVIAGKDAKTNEIIVKKHLGKGDMFLHADVHGGSACVVKSNGSEIPLQTLQEAAVSAGVFSRAWKQGIAGVDVYAVSNEQVSKHAMAGESLGKGAFMVYGERKWFRDTKLEFFIGIKKENSGYVVISGPESAVKKNVVFAVEIVQGKETSDKTARTVLSLFEKKLGMQSPVLLEEIVSMLPGNGTSARV